MITIAIDPGITGAIAVLIDGEYGDVASMPIAQKRSGSNQVDALELFDIIEDFAGRGGADAKVRCIIELVSAGGPAMRGRSQGISSAFNFGDSFGVARTVGAYHAHQVDFVTPAVWKKAAKLTNDKEYSRSVARRVFPAARAQLERKKDEGRAEALLLARYGFRDHKW